MFIGYNLFTTTGWINFIQIEMYKLYTVDKPIVKLMYLSRYQNNRTDPNFIIQLIMYEFFHTTYCGEIFKWQKATLPIITLDECIVDF